MKRFARLLKAAYAAFGKINLGGNERVNRNHEKAIRAEALDAVFHGGSPEGCPAERIHLSAHDRD